MKDERYKKDTRDERYKSHSEDEKQKLVEYRKNIK